MAKRYKNKISLREVLGPLSDAIKEEVKTTLMDGAQQIKTDAQANINSYFRVKSGRLRASLSISDKMLDKAYVVYIKAKAINPKDKVNYAAIIEFSPHKHGHPFLMPAVRAHKGEIHNKILDAIRRGLTKK